MQELFRSIGIGCLYYLPLAGIAFLLRFFIKIPDEIFRKLLHFILVGSTPAFIFCSGYMAVFHPDGHRLYCHHQEAVWET